jgi:hypothetical protein
MKLSLYLIKVHAINSYGNWRYRSTYFYWIEEDDQLPIPSALPQLKGSGTIAWDAG